ncbi:MAG TPA: hypothetical protein VKA12_09610 [Roseiarcus sp.]|nr:hypothetical protein [Roseiarcus sp.]
MGHEKIAFSYSEVETALTKAFRILDVARGAFRARIKNFQKLGLVPSSPGKGRKISYRRVDIFTWAIALEFAEFGIDPSLIGPFINFFAWRFVERHLLNDGPDKLFVFYPNLLSGWGRDADKPQHMAGLVCAVVDSLSEIEERRAKAQGQNIHYDLLCSRLGMINLGRLRRDVEQALANPD